MQIEQVGAKPSRATVAIEPVAPGAEPVLEAEPDDRDVAGLEPAGFELSTLRARREHGVSELVAQRDREDRVVASAWNRTSMRMQHGSP